MRRTSRLVHYLILTVVLVLGASPLMAESRPNPMHPAFQLLDAQGKMIRPGGQEPDQVQTCGQCHSSPFIAGHNLPAHQQQGVSCLSCHFEGGEVNWRSVALDADGMVKRPWLRIYKPSVANCGTNLIDYFLSHIASDMSSIYDKTMIAGCDVVRLAAYFQPSS